ncbi:hypothetical protein V2J09_018794 [Rumex salicifolius]
MGSYLPGAGRNTATTAAAATYGFDREIELLKTTFKASSYSSSSSPNSTISESSNSLSPALSICTRKSRTPRKRPNQTYNEAAALLSTAYPNVFSHKHLEKPPSFKFAKPTDSAGWLNSAIGEELLLPDKPFEPRLGMVSSSHCSNYSDTSSERPCQSPMEENGGVEEDNDFDTESFLNEEIGGIDSVMGILSVRGDNCHNNQLQQTANFCYGLPMGLGLGLGLLGGRFDFGFGTARGVKALRNSPHSRYGGSGEWWRYPAMTTVDVEAISPTLEKKPALEKKKINGGSSKKKKAPEEKVKETEASISVPAASTSDCRIQLKLNYDDVLSAWSDRGSAFSDDTTSSELRGVDVRARLAQIDLFGENEGAREASVQRYKEKRRTRIFSKKIRYQVRKVNADSKIRIKGRFVRSPDSSGDSEALHKQ